MGFIISKFQKKKSQIEILEMVSKQISEMEDWRRRETESHKRLWSTAISYFVFFYLLFLAFLYFRYNRRWGELWLHWKLVLPFLSSPLLLLFLRRILSWFYSRQRKKKDAILLDLKMKKKSTLEEVMEKETFKVAKEILEKYSPESLNQSVSVGEETHTNNSVKSLSSTGSTEETNEIRRRSMPTRPSKTIHSPSPSSRTSLRSHLSTSPRPPGPPLPRPLIPVDRGFLDKFVEYLIGDGPSNRYALICKQCQSHNGMALKEEFEFISYRCCYCHFWNSARKERPTAPKLILPSFIDDSEEIVGEGEKGGENDDSKKEETRESAVSSDSLSPPINDS